MKIGLSIILAVLSFILVIIQYFLYLTQVYSIVHVLSLISIVTGVLFIFLAICISFRDPGRLRKPIIRSREYKLQKLFQYSDYTQFQSQYCQTCQIILPTFTTHCGACNSCIFMFDHHCSYLSCDIGARNYLLFLIILRVQILFFISSFILATYLLKISIINTHLQIFITCPYLQYFSFFGIGFSVNMIQYHNFLLKNNLTTKLYLKTDHDLKSLAKSNILRANNFLDEVQIELIDKFNSNIYFNYLSFGWQRALLGFFIPRFELMDLEDAQFQAFQWSIYLTQLKHNLPEYIIKYM